MLKKRAPEFHELVWQTASRVGNSAPRVTNEILDLAFPATAMCARDEGAETMLRRGVVEAVKRVLRSVGGEEPEQHDFSEIDPLYWDHVSILKSARYFVEEDGEYVSLPRLIKEPEKLDDARRFMRKKGRECIAEADALDELYFAVTDGPAPAEGSTVAA